jgi:mRNA-degrading endonuclease RelE of RelBE toxin-antitoxin system
MTTRRVPVYIIQPPSPTPNLEYFNYVALQTDYTIRRTGDFEKKYDRVDNTIREKVDRAIEKLETNVDMPGFNWRNCRTGYQYVRINQQMRMIVNRDNAAKEIELVDFDADHDLPEEYGCYN